MKRVWAIVSLIGACAFAGQVTLTFTPQIKWRVEAGHSYTLWASEHMTGTWEVVTSKAVTNHPYDVTVDYTFMSNAPNFFFLQVDDEPLQFPTPPTNNVSTNAPPPAP